MTMKTITRLVATFAFVAAFNTYADNWQWSLGINYRTFDDVDFADYKVRHTDAATGDVDHYVNGTNSAVEFITVVDAAAQTVGGSINLDQINVNDESDNLDDGYGLTFELRNIAPEADALASGFSLSLGYLTGDLNETMNGAVTTDSFDIDGGALGGGAFDVDQPTAAQQDQVGLGLTTGDVTFDVEVDALTLSAGYLGLYQGDTFGFSFGFGPTVTFADARTEAKSQVSWSAAAPAALAGDDIPQQQDEDDETDVLFGLYASVGIEFSLSDSARLALEYRYDFVFDDIDTDLADIDLSGQSIGLKLIFDF